MITELEQEFFKVFGIEPIPLELYGYWLIKGTIKNGMVYPEITDRKLLEMICILNSIYDCGFKNNTSLASKEVKYLKMEILKYCILHKEQIKTQIQQLFKEGE